MWRTPATLAGSLDDVPNPGPGMTILALETSCDDTCAAVLDDDGRALSNVISSQHVHDRFGGVVPEIASRHHLEIVNASSTAALADAGADLGDLDLIAATQGPGLIGALLVGLSTGKALAAAPPAALRPGRPSAGARGRQLPARGGGSAPVRAPLPVPDRLGRAHAAGARDRPRRLRGPRPHARRRGGRGVRQGRADAGAGVPGRAGPAAPGRGRRPGLLRLPGIAGGGEARGAAQGLPPRAWTSPSRG